MDTKPEDSIQVCIRIRPGQQQQTIVQFTQNQIHLDKNHFGFDKIFCPNATQEQVFQSVGTKLISHTLDGYNGCIFVYGQTGSGKTYTMIGDNNGVMHQSFIWLFRQIQQLQKTQCSISCSYYQIYNEQIIDLLDTKKQKKLTIRQDIKKGVFIENIVEETVYSELKLLQCLNTGMRNRHVGETMMNRQSSRSHSIFTVSISIKTQVNGMQILKTPKLHFVDLAGSQRQKMTAASGERLKQAGNINKSLTTLGMVINALASEKIRTHIPYRDSKLTSLLRDSLGGNSKTFLIATISRNISCFQQTLSTLNFANRAKMVKVKALVNQQSLSTNIEAFKQQIKRLKAEILRLKSEKISPNISQSGLIHQSNDVSSIVNYDNQFKQINGKISLISQQLCKNSVSPSFQQILQQIQKLRPLNNSSLKENSSQMVEQNNQNQIDMQNTINSEQNQDPLIQYLTCNNALLQKIHSKVQEYVEMKEHLRSLAYNNQMSIAALKTPSKFERQQLETIIEKRNQQILKLSEQIQQYRNLLVEQELKFKQVYNQAKGKTQMSEQSIDRYQKQQAQLLRQVNTLRNLVKKTNEDIEIMNKKLIDTQNQSKQNKELYLFAQQNYETQKLLRDQVEKNLLQKINYIEQIKLQNAEKLQEQKQYFQQMEQELRQELNVLAQTVQFNQNLLSQCKTRLQSQKTINKQLSQKVVWLQNALNQSQLERAGLEQKQKQTNQILQSTYLQIEELKTTYSAQLNCKNKQIQKITNEHQIMLNQHNQKFVQLDNLINAKCIQSQQLKQQLRISLQQSALQVNQYQLKISQIVRLNQQKVNEIQDQHSLAYQQYEAETNQLKNKIQIYEKQQLQNINALKELRQQLTASQQYAKKVEEECNLKIKTIYQETKTKLQQAKVLEIENEEMKKQYRILQKQNYKIKAKYSENNNKTQEQLALKVDYYEQKFKLMSIQYQKAVQVVKRLKQKELSQAQKIAGLEQSHKIMKISFQSTNNSNQKSSALKVLSQENQQLKRQLQNIKTQNSKQESAQSYLNKKTFQQQKTILKQKQQYFKKKIKQSINRWDPSKQNILVDRNLEQLIQCWEDLQAESCKKFEAIAKGIKRQQKLKTQNSLILKQNIYLKQQLSALQRQCDDNLGNPRKKLKLQLALIPEESMEERFD